jgi:hypothetical protein
MKDDATAMEKRLIEHVEKSHSALAKTISNLMAERKEKEQSYEAELKNVAVWIGAHNVCAENLHKSIQTVIDSQKLLNDWILQNKEPIAQTIKRAEKHERFIIKVTAVVGIVVVLLQQGVSYLLGKL